MDPTAAVAGRCGRRTTSTASAAPAEAAAPAPWLGPLTVSALVFAGVAALLASTGVLDVDIEVAGAIALGIVGTLILSAWFGRARGLVPLADPHTRTGCRRAHRHPARGRHRRPHLPPGPVRELEHEYRLAIGTMQLDLRDAPLRVGTTT